MTKESREVVELLSAMQLMCAVTNMAMAGTTEEELRKLFEDVLAQAMQAKKEMPL